MANGPGTARQLHDGSPMLGSSTVQHSTGSAVFVADRSSTAAPRVLLGLAATLGALALGVFLCSRNIADGDLWAKLALGAHVWQFGTLPLHDSFAFTPVLPDYVDHEWGAGTVFFGLLKLFGPSSLMCLKILLAFGAIGGGLVAGRKRGCGWGAMLLLALPASPCVVLGYIPVIRSHTFTYCFFALTLLMLEEILSQTTPGRRSSEARETQRAFWLAGGLGLIMLVWVNVHGGFVAGLGTIGIYACFAAFQELSARVRVLPGATAAALARVGRAVLSPPSSTAGSSQSGSGDYSFLAGLNVETLESSACPRRRLPARSEQRALPVWVVLSVAVLICLLATCVNPYGVRFWSYLLPAVLAKRPLIAEWQPLPIFAWDIFIPFRVLFVLVSFALVVGWKQVGKKSWTGLIMLALTAFLAWRSRRHAPFFGVASLAFAGPYLTAASQRVSRWLTSRDAQGQGTAATQFPSPLPVVVAYTCLAVYACAQWLPQASLQTLAPVGHDPVREADILSLAGAKGNLATPFHWGSYSAWRLHPELRVSMDGRYEAAYPESTFRLNASFFDKTGPDWERLIREYQVDYIMLDLTQPGLRPEDLTPRGYSLIWLTEGSSALMALGKHAEQLRQVAQNLPPTTIEPLDARIPNRWWAAGR